MRSKLPCGNMGIQGFDTAALKTLRRRTANEGQGTALRFWPDFSVFENDINQEEPFTGGHQRIRSFQQLVGYALAGWRCVARYRCVSPCAVPASGVQSPRRFGKLGHSSGGPKNGAAALASHLCPETRRCHGLAGSCSPYCPAATLWKLEPRKLEFIASMP